MTLDSVSVGCNKRKDVAGRRRMSPTASPQLVVRGRWIILGAERGGDGGGKQ